MRTQTIGGITVVYPDALVYDGDFNYVTASAPDSTTTVVGVTLGGRTAQYVSSSAYSAVEIGTLLKSGNNYGSLTLSIYISRDNPAFSTTLSVQIYLVHGRSVPTCYHGSGRHIILPYGASEVQIPVVAAGKVSDGLTPLTLNDPQIVNWPLGNDTLELSVQYDEARLLGDFANVEKTDLALFAVERVKCLHKDEVYIGWYDIDGCERYVNARIISRRRSSENIIYTPGLNILRTLPNRLVANTSEIIEVGIIDVDIALRLDEIVWSESVWVLNAEYDTTPVIIDGDINIDLRNFGEIILKFKTLI